MVLILIAILSLFSFKMSRPNDKYETSIFFKQIPFEYDKLSYNLCFICCAFTAGVCRPNNSNSKNILISFSLCSYFVIVYCKFGIRIMPIAHIDLFRNALFNLFTLSADSYISLFLLFSRGEREGIIYTELA